MFIAPRFYLLAAAVVLVFALGHALPVLFVAGKVLLALLLLAVAVDAALLWGGTRIQAERILPQRFSCGDSNEAPIHIESSSVVTVRIEVIDELPLHFLQPPLPLVSIKPRQRITVHRTLRPFHRGVFRFGQLRLFCRTRIGLLERRFTYCAPTDVKVYPSFLYLRQTTLPAIARPLAAHGTRRVEQAGHQTDFEHIQEYVNGDDYRTINWKATARRARLMVNVRQDERSQPVYCIIDRGRAMQRVEGGLTLLDHSINAALALSRAVMLAGDRAGLISFCQRVDAIVPASCRPGHMHILLEQLYAAQSTFGETDYTALCAAVGHHLNRRTLLVVFTQASHAEAMQRQLPALQLLARRHCVVVALFRDSELEAYARRTPQTTGDYFRRVAAQRSIRERKLTAAVLRQNGINALLTTPARLTGDIINKYLELKRKRQF